MTFPADVGLVRDDQAVDVELDRAERQLRIQVYETFRENRAEYDRRMTQIQAAHESYVASEPDATLRQDYLDWIQSAKRASAHRSIGSIPAFRSTRSSGVVRRGPSEPAEAARTLPGRGQGSVGPRVTGPRSEVPIGSIFGSRKPHVDARLEPRLARSSIGPAVPNRSTVQPPLDEPLPLPRFRIAESLVAEELVDTLSDTTQLPADPSVISAATSTPDGPSPVDLSVLAAKIRSVNLNLKDLDNLLWRTDEWTVDQLQALVDEFERLDARRHLTALYLGSLSDDQRRGLEELLGTGPSIMRLKECLFQTRLDLMDQRVRGSDTDPNDAIQRLQKLSGRIETWTLNQAANPQD